MKKQWNIILDKNREIVMCSNDKQNYQRAQNIDLE